MLIDLKVDKILPGHGPLCDKDEVRRQLEWFKEIRRIMRGLIEEGATEEEAAGYEYPVLYGSDRPERVKQGYARWYRVWKG
jgi:glyoxylase-like metal-dependent hydrolase (beta-lactamase superfamily II)